MRSFHVLQPELAIAEPQRAIQALERPLRDGVVKAEVMAPVVDVGGHDAAGGAGLGPGSNERTRCLLRLERTSSWTPFGPRAPIGQLMTLAVLEFGRLPGYKRLYWPPGQVMCIQRK